MSSRLKPSPSASAATSATKTVHVWPEVGRPVAQRGQPPELGDVVHAVGDRLLLEERAGAGAADAVHVGVDDAAVLDVDELGVLAADLDDGEAAAAVRVERRGGRVAWATISFCTVRRSAEVREGGAEDGRRGVAAGAGEADGDHRARRHLGDLGDQRLGRLDGVALGAPVDARQDGAGGGVDERGLGAGGAEVEAEDGRGASGAGAPADAASPRRHDRAGPLSRRLEPADAAAHRPHELLRVGREAGGPDGGRSAPMPRRQPSPPARGRPRSAARRAPRTRRPARPPRPARR